MCTRTHTVTRINSVQHSDKVGTHVATPLNSLHLAKIILIAVCKLQTIYNIALTQGIYNMQYCIAGLLNEGKLLF